MAPPFCLHTGQAAAGSCQRMQGVAGDHGTQRRHGLHTPDIFPLILGNGIQPDHPPGQPLALLQRRHRPWLIDGLGV